MLKLKIENMTCNHCISLVTKAIKQQEGSALVEVDLSTNTATIDSLLDEQDIITALDEIGYSATKISSCCSKDFSCTKV